MAEQFAQEVLSDALRSAIAGRTVTAAVFLTFRFEPAFFEAEILPNLFDQVFSQAEKIRVTQLEDLMPRLKLSVYYDRNGLDSGTGPARLDYRRIALGRATGYFHPKNVMLLLEKPTEDGPTVQSLLYMTLSANLTRAGWWENVEVAQIEEVVEGERCPYRGDLLELFSRIRQEDRVRSEDAALEDIRSFADRKLEDTSHQRKDGRLRPQVYVGHGPVDGFIRDRVPRGEYNLEVIAPYHADSDGTLERLLDAVQPKETRILEPLAADGVTVACSAEYYAAVAARPKVCWATLPAYITGAKPRAKAEKPRFVHAKVYRLWNRESVLYFVGSVNFTDAAFSTGKAGNFETGVLVEPEPDGRPGWLLEPVSAGRKPAEFKDQPLEEAEHEPVAHPFHLRFDWSTTQLHYYWEVPETLPARIDVSAGGVPKFTVTAPSGAEWKALGVEAAQSIRALLASTSFVEVSVDGGASFPLLVREEGMRSKPSLVQSLTVEEILLYWSLLSPEQKEHFLSLKIPLGDGSLPTAGLGTLEGQDTMFGQFAGIYHAFGRLESEVWEALGKGPGDEPPKVREAVADYRLFGEKHDSLPTLLDRLETDDKGDPVNRYVIALCARQLVKRLRRDFPEYCQKNSSALRDLVGRIERGERVREALSVGAPEQQSKFLEWFERMFLMEMEAPQGDTP